MTKQKNEAGLMPQLPPELQFRKPKQIQKSQEKEVRDAFLTYLQSTFPGVCKLKFKFCACTSHVIARARYKNRYLYAKAWTFPDCIAKFVYEYNTKVLYC